MQALYTATEVRALENAAAASTRELMERAGRALAAVAEKHLDPQGRVLILAGPGNNGGDGLVAARALQEAGRVFELVLLTDPSRLPPDAADAHRALLAVGVRPRSTFGDPQSVPPGQGDVVIDAVFGTGLNRAPQGTLADAIRAILGHRDRGARVVAADLPSGVAGDTGVAFEPSVVADETVVFGVAKPAHALQPGRSQCGTQTFVDLDLPEPPGPPKRALLDAPTVRAMLPTIRVTDHKGTFGHVLIVAGSEGKSGAAALSALGALRAGAGLVTVAAPRPLLSAILAHAPEVMGLPLDVGGDGLSPAHLGVLQEAADARDSVVLGPGIPRGPQTLALLEGLLGSVRAPMVIDADGLNALSGSPALLERAAGPLVLTPHPGELGRLLGQPTAQVQADRLGAASALHAHAGPHGLTVVFKGAGTVIACGDGTLRINPTGHPGMGTGGTGDVLAGILGALLAGGMSPDAAACVGTYVHGLAAEKMRVSTGLRGMLASDLLEGLCRVWREWETGGVA